MAITTAANAANRWASGMGTASEKMKSGVMAVTVSPTARAAQRADAYLQGVMRAVQSGKYADALNRVTLSDWQTAMVNKGIPRVAAGAAEGKGKFQAFMQQFLPWIQQGQQQLESMPRGDLETNIQRMVTMVRWNSQFKRSG
jgi:hypothetical protein